MDEKGEALSGFVALACLVGPTKSFGVGQNDGAVSLFFSKPRASSRSFRRWIGLARGGAEYRSHSPRFPLSIVRTDPALTQPFNPVTNG